MEQPASAQERWSSALLPPELLSLIVSKCTPAAAYYVILRRVCSQWRRSLTDYSPVPPLPSPQLPFLLLPPHITWPPSPLGRVFPLPFRNPFHRATSFALPQLANTHDRICVGSSHGWLITLSTDSSVSLLNPVTADSLPLRPLSSIDNAILNFNPDNFPRYHLPQKDKWHSQLDIIHRVVLSSDPAKDRDFTVLMFLSGLTDCCFTWSGRGDTWSRHVHPPLVVEDVVFVNGVFVTIDRSISLAIFNFGNRETGLVVTLYQIFQKAPIRDAFLVNADDHLLIVIAGRLRYPNRLFIPRRYISVYAFPVAVEVSGGTIHYAVQIRTLRNVALFVGHGCSMSVSVRHFPWLTEGAVYFPHVYSMVEEVEEGGERRIALYQGAVYQNIITGISYEESIKVFDVENSPHPNLWVGPRPFWVSPNLNRR